MELYYILLTKRAKYVRIFPSFNGGKQLTDFEGGCHRNYIQGHGIFSMITGKLGDGFDREVKLC